MLSVFEMNVGHACGAYTTQEMDEVLGALAQGHAQQYWAEKFARLRRRVGTAKAEAAIYELANVAAISDLAARSLPFENRADLLDYTVERGVHMGRAE